MKLLILNVSMVMLTMSNVIGSEQSVNKSLSQILTESKIEKNRAVATQKKSQKKVITPPVEKKQTIQSVAKDGAKVVIEVVDLVNSIFQLEGKGFKPNESLLFKSRSCHEVLSHPITADEKGNIYMGILPAVEGKWGGICYISFIREENGLHIDCPSGTEAFKKDSVWFLKK